MLQRAAALLLGALVARGDHHEPPLPVLPNTFSTMIEANFATANYTLRMFEAYDTPNNRAYFKIHDHEDHHSNHLFLFDYNIAFEWEGEDGDAVYPKNCKAVHAEQDPSFRVVGTRNGANIDLKTTAQMFRFSGQNNPRPFSETFQGYSRVRGIPSVHWKHTFDTSHMDEFSDTTFPPTAAPTTAAPTTAPTTGAPTTAAPTAAPTTAASDATTAAPGLDATTAVPAPTTTAQAQTEAPDETTAAPAPVTVAPTAPGRPARPTFVFSVDFHFIQDSVWHINGSVAADRPENHPLLAEVKGNCTSDNHTQGCPHGVPYFHNFYNYVDFEAGPVAPHLFLMPGPNTWSGMPDVGDKEDLVYHLLQLKPEHFCNVTEYCTDAQVDADSEGYKKFCEEVFDFHDDITREFNITYLDQEEACQQFLHDHDHDHDPDDHDHGNGSAILAGVLAGGLGLLFGALLMYLGMKCASKRSGGGGYQASL